MNIKFATLFSCCLLSLAFPALGEEDLTGVKAPPQDPKYLTVVKRSADAMLEYARDNYGPEHSGMIISILQCKDGKPLTGHQLPTPPNGVRGSDRTGIGGSNTNIQMDLFRVLGHLSRLTGDPRYKEAENQALSDFLRITQDPTTGFLAWGEHLYWNCFKDTLGMSSTKNVEEAIHEPKRKLIFFDYLYSVDPERTLKYAHGLWDHQIANQKTGDFSRHAHFNHHGPGSRYDFPKEGSYFIDTWSEAYGKTKDPVFLQAIQVLAKRYQSRTNERGLLDYDSSMVPDRMNTCVPLWSVSLAIECHDAALRTDPATAEILNKLKSSMDRGFLSLAHVPEDVDKGFVAFAATDSGELKPQPQKNTLGYSNHWGMGYGIHTTAQFATLAYTRQAQLGSGEQADAYRKLITRAADLYLKLPDDPEKVDIWAGEYGMVINAELAAYRVTKDAKYLTAAQKYGDEAIKVLWGDNVMPKASSKTAYYDCISYPDTLMMSLLALHEQVNHLEPKVEISDLTR